MSPRPFADSPASALYESTPLLVFGGAAILLAAFLYTRAQNASKRGPLPPSPKGAIPIFGHMFMLPKSRPWVKMEEWTRELGPIYTLKLGSQTVVVVGRAPVAMDLLDKRSAIYSSRPRLIMTSDLVSRGLRMTFMQYGDLWRRQRKLLHSLTSPKASSSYEPIQSMESAQLVRDMIQKPKMFWGHCQRSLIVRKIFCGLRRYAGSTIMQVAFNKRAPTHDDHAITEMRKINERMTKTAVAGRYIVDSLPFLNVLPKPLAPWKQEADTLFEETLSLFKSHYDGVNNEVKEGRDVHCFATEILRLRSQYDLSETEAIFLAGAMYGAGSDTTADGISTFILMMVAHPHVLAKAQEELDRVIGHERLPEFSDQDDLVYCQAVVRECLRFRTIIAGGLGHRSTEDDVYNGYFIPKGTTVLANHWAIHLDPEVYPEPNVFNPDRFIVDDKLVGTKYAERGHHAYGFGRRICPGMHIADRSLFIVFTRMMWACKIEHEVDEHGVPIPVDIDRFSEGFSSHPLPFQCKISSRGKWAEEAIELAVQQQP
ncbi:BZ3500_MvSof-1268-A1-R1_Chr1-3g01685 [Microbotryum saponariae]|uniref:BZ3500_MvSof-1268-A1-R1_Chr1-3g01685 protein n=1 Tax=Microbotryum saponariae TaxID=289078 RepID=A0A2X0KUP9_9BASI|nr:BZ3500_MvSof-1268-A1-R1_Chr1-3g01685 [Microbotryum saponariae]SCZ94316.1 BZ3501_MvSof-1269-A2-R1_Chr1-3g01286 [Microbotryum saponariae]